MATQTGVLNRDQNLKFHFDGKEANVYKVQKKQGIGGRKALGDLTNSGKPSPIKASKRHDSKIFTSVGEEIDAFRSKDSIRGKKSISKAQEKVQTSGRRKPLSDVSNTKNQKNVKLTSVMKEYFLPNSIAEEQFLHNHEECIKAQNMNMMSKDYFLETIGLHNDFSMQLPSCHVPPASSRKPKVQPGSPRKLELEEIAELMIEDKSPLCLKRVPSEYQSFSSPPKTPKSPNLNVAPDYFLGLLQMDPNFTMIETPVLPKH